MPNPCRPSAIGVIPLEAYQILISFDNGERRLLDMTSYLHSGFFAPLRSKAVFDTVHINPITVEWHTGSGEIDICPDELYFSSVPI